jgi:transposase, IS6 family
MEQDHRALKRVVKPGLGFGSFATANRTLAGYEAMHMLRKGQVDGASRGDIGAQVRFIETAFGIAA